MKDFVSGRDMDIQALLRMVRYAEEAEEFDMGTLWGCASYSSRGDTLPHPCGTSGCLLGTFTVRERDRWSFEFWSSKDGEARRFGISRPEASFLFYGGEFGGRIENAADLSKEQAIARLRKFLYYKMRKSELLEDYEGSRKMEGDHGFAIVPQERFELAYDSENLVKQNGEVACQYGS